MTCGVIVDVGRLCAVPPGGGTVLESQAIGLVTPPADAHAFDAEGRVMRCRMAPALVA